MSKTIVAFVIVAIVTGAIFFGFFVASVDVSFDFLRGSFGWDAANTIIIFIYIPVFVILFLFVSWKIYSKLCSKFGWPRIAWPKIVSITQTSVDTLKFDGDDPVANLNRIITDIDRRMRKLQRQATANLVLIFLILSAAVAIIIFAGLLTSLDVTAASILERAETRVSNAIARIDRVNVTIVEATKQQAELDDEIKSIQDELISPGKKTAAKLKEDLSTARANKVAHDAVLKNLIDTRDRHIEAVKAAESTLDIAWRKEIDASGEDKLASENFLIAASVTRISVIVIIVFLIQILIGLYRYNVRLATFYGSRKDLLLISGGDLKKCQEAIMIFTPDQVDFGRVPKPMIQEVAGVFGFGRRRKSKQNDEEEEPKEKTT